MRRLTHVEANDAMIRILSTVSCVLLAALAAAAVGAAEVSRADVQQWLDQDVTRDPPPPGTVIGSDAIDTLDPWLPPGYRDEFRFDDVAIEIEATGDYPPHPSYRAASEQFDGQAQLGPGHELENYTAGQPFSAERIAAAAPGDAGFMVAWNQIQRWQYTGYRVDELTMSYIGDVSAPGPLDPDAGLLGGGTLLRRLHQSYHRVYLSKLAWLGDENYRFDVPSADSRLFKDHIAFLAPFDVAGTQFVVERNLDPHADDQVNIYSPTERRVRRFSAKERADKFMGSEATLDDFEGFSGRVLDYEWELLGRHSVLAVMNARGAPVAGYGPHSRVPREAWQVRDCYVVEARSTWEGHPYGSRVLFIDTQTFGALLSLVFDHDAMLWKTLQTVHRAPAAPDGDLEHSVPSWRAQFNVDRVTNSATVVQAMTETEHPALKASWIKRAFSVSNLTQGR